MRSWMVITVGMALTVGLRAGAAVAGEFPSGDWAWSVDDAEFVYAGTENDTGQILAQFCYLTDGNCIYVVGFDTNCEEGHSYPAMVNTDKGAAAVQFRCGGKFNEDGNLMVAEDFEQFDKFIRSSARIGFALPMEGDKFKAIRFRLKGAVPALDAMRKIALNALQSGADIRNVKDGKDKKDSEVF